MSDTDSSKLSVDRFILTCRSMSATTASMRQGLSQLFALPHADAERHAWKTVLPFVRGLRDELTELIRIIEESSDARD